MNLDQIETKCFILALFIRDDGERFLLGSMAYEFVDSQLHFVANSYQNDIVEVQGNDGVMLAGQVRRGTSQPFDGYIGDQTVDRFTIEQYRRDFMKFFRKNHYYKVVYVFPDGSAVQRRNGFIVEAPEVKELYQLFPQYHISMNFEDINYYVYEEDSDGEEIYGESAILKIATSATGGLIWEEGTESEITGDGSQFTLQDTIDGNVLDSVQLKGDITQQTYSGKNLYEGSQDWSGNWTNSGSWETDSSTYNGLTVKKKTGNWNGLYKEISVDAGKTYTFSVYVKADSERPVNIYISGGTATTSPAYSSTITATTEWQRVYLTFTVSVAGTIRARIESTTSVTSNYTYICGYQLEESPSMTSYEPYTAGPAPNPDYPQEVNNVTGRQVVTISDGDSQSQEYEVNLGKNLCDLGTQSFTGFSSLLELTQALPAGTYIFSAQVTSSDTDYDTCYIRFMQDSSSASGTGYIARSNSRTSVVITTTAPTNSLYLYASRSASLSSGDTATFTNIQIEKGSTATSYAPYFTPIELCKIGDYQDYIYKSGDDWYVHKETEKVDLSALTGWYLNNNTNFRTITGVSEIAYPADNDTIGAIISASYTANKASNLASGSADYGIALGAASYISIRNKDITTLTDFTTYLANNQIYAYVALATPTDTQITNADLIAQLEALLGATTYDGQTAFTVSSENQLAILDVTVIARTGGGVVWDNYGAEWEEGTGGGPTMVNIDSIDNVYPVWTVTGPAVNPQISVLTTNTTLSYSGTVTSSQELKIDMFNKTATLNGASVIGNVSGDWVYLKPGVNRITYTTNNADAPDSTIWWQEIVG